MLSVIFNSVSLRFSILCFHNGIMLIMPLCTIHHHHHNVMHLNGYDLMYFHAGDFPHHVFFTL